MSSRCLPKIVELQQCLHMRYASLEQFGTVLSFIASASTQHIITMTSALTLQHDLQCPYCSQPDGLHPSMVRCCGTLIDAVLFKLRQCPAYSRIGFNHSEKCRLCGTDVSPLPSPLVPLPSPLPSPLPTHLSPLRSPLSALFVTPHSSSFSSCSCFCS